MARRDVIEITCDRCGRTETQTSTEAPKSTGPEVETIFQGEKVTFHDLCKRCREAVRGYHSRIAKKPEEPAAATVAPPAAPHAEEPKKRSFLGGK